MLEIPSNLALERFGARIWIARIMATWGIISMLMIFVRGPWSFVAMRFLLGLAEAGFFPGVILYLTYWFPSRIPGADRGRVHDLDPDLVLFWARRSPARSSGSAAWACAAGNGCSSWKACPQSSWRLRFSAFSRTGRAAPRGCRPTNAAGSSSASRLRPRANAARRRDEKPTLLEMLRDRKLIIFTAIYFGSTASSYGLTFWTPQIVKSYGLTNFQTGLLNSIPYGIACVAMILWGRHSDRHRERRWHLAIPFLVLAAGLAGGHGAIGSRAAGVRPDGCGLRRLHDEGAVLGHGDGTAADQHGGGQHRRD